MITHTGHAEIDQQHSILEGMLKQLTTLCTQIPAAPAPSCSRCSDAQQQQCSATLGRLLQQLSSFLIGHNTYEERMMDLLPDTPVCQNHIRTHKAAHEVIARRLRKLRVEIESDDPQEASLRIWEIIADWLGNHTDAFDRRLVGLQDKSEPEIDYDGELVAMLDQHVFPNRPRADTAHHENLHLKKQRLQTRGRYESLSPAQRKVFWLVVAGRKNKEIAGEMGISVNTVKSHRTAIFQKMEVSSVLELVKEADALRL